MSPRARRLALVWGVALLAMVALLLTVAGRQGHLGPGAPGQGQNQAQGQGTPAIGGPFTLVDGDGKTVTEADFRGRYMLVFFGYTYCPDVCPTTLQTISTALDMLDPAIAAKVVPVFISVDPARDTPQVMADYVAHFRPGMVGLTGTEAQVAAAAHAWRVYYAKAPGAGDSGDDYLVDHSAILYLMGPDGAYVSHFSHDADAQKIAEGLKEWVK